MPACTLNIDIPQLKREMSEAFGLTERKINPVFKEGLQHTARYWKGHFLQAHFIRGAYTFYPEVYTKQKRSPGRPLYITGKLHHELMSDGNVAISGTSNHLTMKLKYGRPPRYKRSNVDALMRQLKEQYPYWSDKQLAMETYGRLREEGEKTIMRRIVTLVVKNGMSYAKAAATIYSQEGYSPEAKEAFQRMVAYVNEPENQKLKGVFRDYVAMRLQNPKSLGKAA